MQGEVRRVGMVAVIGRPNVGKSTLVNALVGEPVSITSRKPQTTRDRVLGVRTDPDAQYIFVDTPGFQRQHRSALNRHMNQAVTGALAGVDAIVLVVDAARWKPADTAVVELLPAAADHVILALNKTDLLADRERLLPLMAESMQRYPFHAIVPVSAEKQRQLADLLGAIRDLLPKGCRCSTPINTPIAALASWRPNESGKRPTACSAMNCRMASRSASTAGTRMTGAPISRRLWSSVATSHKGIVIGREGAKLREISRLARADIQEMLGKAVHLEVWVKVKQGWSDDPGALRCFGYG